MSLLEELEKERKSIKTDGYRMSIGEIINLYKEGDLKLNPAFQRLFRWSDYQKTKFIESILLGIPIPEIFVAQDLGGNWTLVDGVQRVSTILQLVGVLPDKEPLIMTEVKYLPSLNGQSWVNLPEDIQRLFKRSKLGINIISTENSIKTQYELFQRLNTGGLHLEFQEIRNCIIIMLNEDFYHEINELKEFTAFKNLIRLTEKKYEEEYHMELILRYFIAVYGDIKYQHYSLSSIHLSEFIDKETVELLQNDKFNIEEAINSFKEVFSLLNSISDHGVFRKYDNQEEKFKGQFLTSLFEAITTGVATNFDFLKDNTDILESKIKEIQDNPTYLDNTLHGTRSPVRFKNLTEFSRVYFSNEDS